MLTQTLIRALFSYDPETGVCVWLPRDGLTGWNKKHAGRRVGSMDSRGYIMTSIDNKSVALHRLIFAYVTGHFPDEIDHANGDRADNRWSNLRPATRSQNLCNKKMSRHNTSGVKGIGYCPRRHKWFAKITLNRRQLWLGYHKTRESAAQAYRDASAAIHQEFGRTA